ncbi:MAG: hypothetical protein ACJARR_001013 [Pseudophaeobacter arcticus]|jgi:hypothetical protein
MGQQGQNKSLSTYATADCGGRFFGRDVIGQFAGVGFWAILQNPLVFAEKATTASHLRLAAEPPPR